MYVRLVDDVFGVSLKSLQAPSLTYTATQCTEGAAIDVSSSHSGPVASFAPRNNKASGNSEFEVKTVESSSTLRFADLTEGIITVSIIIV